MSKMVIWQKMTALFAEEFKLLSRFFFTVKSKEFNNLKKQG